MCSGGPKPALTSAVFGGVLLALIEGASIMLSKTFSDPNAMAGGLSEEMMKDAVEVCHGFSSCRVADDCGW